VTPQALLHARARRAHSPAERPPTGWRSEAAAPQVCSTRNRPTPRIAWSSYAAAVVYDEMSDSLETPRCPIHPTTRLVDAGPAPDGRDAHWECPIPGCVYVQLG
jgi:hypothetical protein